MRKIVGILLYLSAFLPMLLVMWIKEVILVISDSIAAEKKALIASQATGTKVSPEFDWSCLLNPYLLVALGVIIAITISLVALLKGNKKAATKMVKIQSLTNQVAEHYLAYFSLFVLALIGFSLTSIADIVSLCLLMIILGIVYIRNGMFYMNPTVNIMKSFIYKIEFEERNQTHTRVVVSKEKLRSGETLNIYQSKYDFTIVKNKANPAESEGGANA